MSSIRTSLSIKSISIVRLQRTAQRSTRVTKRRLRNLNSASTRSLWTLMAARPKHNWREHIQIGMGGGNPVPQATTTTQDEQGGPPGFQQGMGGTLYLQFPKSIPDLTPEELKNILAPFLDFEKERSAAVHWIDTLPPEMKKAITERHAIPGMDREEVVAAIGKPDRKVRERDADGYDTEDWIYGHPPDKTVFVHFRGEKVSSIKQYPQ